MKGFGYLAKEGFKNVWNNRIMSIASVCVLVSCLVLTGAASLFSLNVANVVESVGQTNETTVYLDDSVSDLEAVYIGKDIEKISNVTSAEFYSKEDAFEHYRADLGEELFDLIGEEENPLPDAYIVVMDDLSLYDRTVAQIQQIEGVDSINNRGEFAKKLTEISNLVNIISIGVIIALTVISLFIIANTIRATMYSRRFEISIMKSVGATNAFVRMPFLVEGMTIGLISAIVSTIGIAALYEGITAAITSSVSFDVIPLMNVILYVAVAFVVAGILVGFFGSFISIRKYLKKEGNEILGW